jgi:two-component system, chemotaxis family, protein-glutamate methylesterase/glutaminase
VVPAQDIIVIGASAGGTEALRKLIGDLPADLAAAVFVVVHVGQSASILPQILTRTGVLRAIHPEDGQPIENGIIYIAPPDQHLLVEAGHIHLSHGPKENRTRPAINPLFRSAAVVYGPRVAGVILTGLLDDGVSGLWEIKRRGGIAIVQDPKEAVYPSMPYNAIEHVAVDHILKISQMPALLANLSMTDGSTSTMDNEIVSKTVSDITCPECRGTLWEQQKGSLIDYTCRVGHAYSTLAMADHHREAQEKALWAAAVALEEGATIDERLAPKLGSWYKEQASKKREQAAVLKKMLDEFDVTDTVCEEDTSASDRGGGRADE